MTEQDFSENRFFPKYWENGKFWFLRYGPKCFQPILLGGQGQKGHGYLIHETLKSAEQVY